MECTFDYKIILPKCVLKYILDNFLSTSTIKYLSIVNPYLNRLIKSEYGHQPWFNNFLDNILQDDDIFLLELYQTKFLPASEDEFGRLKLKCCRHNSSHCLKFLHQRNPIWHNCEWEDDPLECLEFAYNNGSSLCFNILSNKLSLRCVKYLVALGFQANQRSLYNMILQGNLEGVKYLHEIVMSRTVYSSIIAARLNQLECLIFLHENNYPWDEQTCSSAAMTNSLACLKYAHENGCLWDSETCYSAAKSGSYECLKYAHENGCPWQSSTCSGAAQVGSLECLKYAHENGCLWTVVTCTQAVAYGHFDCLWYAVNNGCSWDKETYEALVTHHLTYDYFKLFDELGCPRSSKIIELLVQDDCLDELKYAHEHNFPFPPDICLTAIRCRAIKCLKFLLNHNVNFDIWNCLNMASSDKNKEIIFILMSYGETHPEIW